MAPRQRLRPSSVMRQSEPIRRIHSRTRSLLRGGRVEANLWVGKRSRSCSPFPWSLDHVGPLTSSVADAAVVLQTISQDSTRQYLSALEQNPAELLVGVPRAFFFEDLNAEIASAVESAIAALRSMVKATVDIEIEVNTERSLQLAESYEYHRGWVASSSDLYQPETLRRIRAEKRLLQNSANEAEKNLRQSANGSSGYFRMWTRSSHPPCH